MHDARPKSPQLLKDFNGSGEIPALLVLFSQTLSSWAKSTEQLNFMDIWMNAFLLRKAIFNFVELGADPSARFSADATSSSDCPMLSELRRRIEKTKADLNVSFPANLKNDPIPAVLSEASAIVDEIAGFVVQDKLSQLEAAVDNLRPIAGGLSEGIIWHTSSPPTASFDLLQTLAATTLQAADLDALSDASARAKQVDLVEHYVGGGRNSTTYCL